VRERPGRRIFSSAELAAGLDIRVVAIGRGPYHADSGLPMGKGMGMLGSDI